jgi:hypothetical protein
MILLREWGIERPLHLSTGVACFNSETIHYYAKKIGISRVIIPRKMNLKEMEILIKKCQDLKVEFEVFIIHSRCFFNDEYCFSWHSGDSTNFCSYFGLGRQYINRRFPSLWKQTIEKIFSNPQSQFKRESYLNGFLREISFCPEKLKSPQHFLQLEGITKKSKGMHPLLPFVMIAVCGLCAIPYFKSMGISVLKIPARGASGGPEAKRKYLHIVQQVIKHPNPTKEFCQSLINSPGFCLGLGRCYYYV